MTSPELAAVRDALAAGGRLDPESPPADQRRLWELVGSLYPLPEGATSEPVDAGGVAAEWVDAPGADPARVMVYLHGGGYVIGGPATHRVVAARLAAAVEARVLLLDYRLAPEHRHPAAVDDAAVAYRWLLGRGYAPGRLCVAGDSAGGGLGLAALLRMRDEGVALPAAVVCVSPWADLACRGPSITDRDGRDCVLSQKWLAAMAAH